MGRNNLLLCFSRVKNAQNQDSAHTFCEVLVRCPDWDSVSLASLDYSARKETNTDKTDEYTFAALLIPITVTRPPSDATPTFSYLEFAGAKIKTNTR
jgi:hypothetical protein